MEDLVGGTAADTFNLGHSFTSVSGSGGADVFNVNASISANLSGDAGADNFNFANGAVLTGTLAGGTESDTLNLSAYSTATDVTLTASAAGYSGTTGAVSGGFSTVDVLTGGTAVNTLTGIADAAATWTSTGSNEGTYLSSGNTLTFSSFANWTGGTGADTFNGVNISGNLVDGGGATTLIGSIISTGTQTYTGDVTAGTVTLSSGGTITATNASNDFTGTVNLTGTTVAITDQNALTLGTVNTGALTIINTGALNLGTGTVNGDLSATSNNGNMTQTGALIVNGGTNLQAGTGSIVLTNPGNDFNAMTAGALGGINIFDIDDLTPVVISAGTGSVVLTAGALPGNGTVMGGSVTLSSADNVTGPLNVSIPQTGFLILSGLANLWQITGVTQPSITATTDGTNVFFNSIGISGSIVDAKDDAQSAVGSQVAAINAQQLTDTFGTDSVAEQVDYGFAGDVGVTPPMDHRLDDTGISVPECFSESNEGVACK